MRTDMTKLIVHLTILRKNVNKAKNRLSYEFQILNEDSNIPS